MSDSVAFVAGATGYTGREVVRLLRERGIAVSAHVRPDSPKLEQWRARFGELGAEVDTTPWTAEAMDATLARLRPDLVFALLGTTRKRASAARREGRDPEAESYERVDYGLTVMLLEACSRAGHRPRFVYLSAAGVPESPTGNAYYDARSRVEARLRESGLPFTVARPSFVTGEDRDESRPGEQLAAALTDAAVSLVGAFGASRLRERWHSMDAATLAAGLVRAALDPAAEGQTLHADALRGPG